MRRSHSLFADDILCGGNVLSQELPWREDGWRQRRRSLRAAVVQIGVHWSALLCKKGSNARWHGWAAVAERASSVSRPSVRHHLRLHETHDRSTALKIAGGKDRDAHSSSA